MSLFDNLVNEALRNQGELAPLRAVVEKELLHHDILREMSEAGLLKALTFIGGTCLRACYGSNRLSEDLDFTGGREFTRESLSDLGRVLEERLRGNDELRIFIHRSNIYGELVHLISNPVSRPPHLPNTQPAPRNAPPALYHIDIIIKRGERNSPPPPSFPLPGAAGSIPELKLLG